MLTASDRDELSSVLSGGAASVSPPPRAPQPRPAPKPRRPPTVKDELADILSTRPEPPPTEYPGALSNALANLKNLPKLVTEGFPAAGRAFVAGQGAPTKAQDLVRDRPWTRYTPIPGAMDIAERVLRIPGSVGGAGAELGPEQAKPLTKSGIENAIWFLPQIVPASREAFSLLRSRFQGAPPPAAPGPPPPVAQPPINVRATVMQPRALPPPPPPALPMGPGTPKALPKGPTPLWGRIPPKRPYEPPIEPPVVKSGQEGFLTKEGAEAFRDITGRPDVELLDAHGRPIRAPEVEGGERNKLREFYKGRQEPRRDLTGPGATGAERPTVPESQIENVFGIELDKPTAPGPRFAPDEAVTQAVKEAAPVDVLDRTLPNGTKATINHQEWTKIGANVWRGPGGLQFSGPTLAKIRDGKPLPPRFEPTAAGQQGVIGGTPARAMPTTKSKAKTPQADLKDTALFGQERAAHERAMEEAQGTLEANPGAAKPAPGAQSGYVRAVEAGDPEGAARALSQTIQDRLKGGGSQGDMFDLPSGERVMLRGVRDGRATVERMGGELKEVPVSDLTAAPEPSSEKGWLAGGAQAIKDRIRAGAGEAPEQSVPKPRARVADFEFEHGVPNLSDPDDVSRLVRSYGGINASATDMAGELRSMPLHLKGKNGVSLDALAETLVDQYPSLGTREEAKETLIDTLHRWQNLKEAKAAKLAAEKEQEALAWEMDTKPAPGPVAPDSWKKAMDFFMNIGEEEGGGPKLGMGFTGLPPGLGRTFRDIRDIFASDEGKLNLGRALELFKKAREKFPMEAAVRRANPNSAALAEIEGWSAWATDRLQERVKLPWHRKVRNVNPEALKDAEEQADAFWRANGKTPAARAAAERMFFPTEVQQALRFRDTVFNRANAARAWFGIKPVQRIEGPYLPRNVKNSDSVSLGYGVNADLSDLRTSPGSHALDRGFKTFREGERMGMEYEDPRNSILTRDWLDFQIIATQRLFERLESKGVIFKNATAARAASPTGQPWIVRDAPGGTWWAATEAEAKLLEQNLTSTPASPFRNFVSYGNALFRNPNLVNPAPHVTKNMMMKAVLARGPIAPYTMARDAVEWARGTNPQLLREFNEAMPFSQSGRTSGDILGAELIRGPIQDAIAGAMRGVSMINRPSQHVIFKWADPAMRYSLFKYYRGKGYGVYEAGNHVWEDLIRYGTRSEATDFWRSWPLNFFVPWRFGTFSALIKQSTTGVAHAMQTALLVGAVDYLREVRYRQDGRWTHLPWDYVEKPIVTLANGKPYDALSVALTTAAFGPGGDFTAKQINDMLNVVQGKPGSADWDRLRNSFWGVSQLFGTGGARDEFNKGNYGYMLTSLLFGEHNALNYETRRAMKGLPEWLPGMKRSPLVAAAEAHNREKQERYQKAAETKASHKPQTTEDWLRAQGLMR